MPPIPPPPPPTSPLLTAGNARQVAAANGIPVEPLAFGAAVNACINAGPRLHPVEARNAGIVATCRRWLEKLPGGGSVLHELGDSNHRLKTVAGLLAAAMDADPVRPERHPGEAGISEYNRVRAWFAAPPLMFWTRPHAFIETTEALDRMLIASDLGDDLPASLLRPPFPACYVRFGRSVQRLLAPDNYWPGSYPARPQGVYVFETTRDSMRTLALAAMHDLPGESAMGMTCLDFLIRDEAQPLNDNILAAVTDGSAGDRSADLALLQTVAKVFLYMASPQAVMVEERHSSEALNKLSRLGPKKAAKLQRQLPDLYDRILLGPSEIPGHGHGEVSPHLRRGHFRMQPHGPQMSLRKLMFIAPTWVRADKLGAPGNE